MQLVLAVAAGWPCGPLHAQGADLAGLLMSELLLWLLVGAAAGHCLQKPRG